MDRSRERLLAMATLYDIPRNDLDAAVEFYEKHKPITASELEALTMLQDDPAELLELARRWRITDPAAEAAAHNDRIVAEAAARNRGDDDS